MTAIARARKRRDEGTALDRQELDRRFAEFDGASFEDGAVLREFHDVFSAVCSPPHMLFRPVREQCRLTCPDKTIRFGGELRSSAGDHIGAIEREVNLRNNIAYHRKLIINHEFRGLGLAAILLLHSMQWYTTVGIKEIWLSAGLTSGPYYWARLGFLFLDPADSRTTQHWFARVNAKLGLGLDCSAERAPREWALLGRADGVSCSLAQIGEAFPDLRERVQLLAQDNGLDLDQSLPVGQAVLLSGHQWRGRLIISPTNQAAIAAYTLARPGVVSDRLQGR